MTTPRFAPILVGLLTTATVLVSQTSDADVGDHCVGIVSSVAKAPDVFRMTYTNKCDECVQFKPVIIVNNKIVPAGSSASLGQHVKSIKLKPGKSQSLTYKHAVGSGKGEARDIRACEG